MSTVCHSQQFMLFLLTMHIRPLVEYCSCVWHTRFVQDLRLLERIQRRWTKQIDGMALLPYGERLKPLNLYSIQGWLLRADLIQCWKICHGHSCILPADLFCQSTQTRTRGHRYKASLPAVNTDVCKRSFPIRCIHIWNSLFNTTICASTISSFKQALNRDIHDLLYGYVWCCHLRLTSCQ